MHVHTLFHGYIQCISLTVLHTEVVLLVLWVVVVVVVGGQKETWLDIGPGGWACAPTTNFALASQIKINQDHDQRAQAGGRVSLYHF